MVEVLKDRSSRFHSVNHDTQEGNMRYLAMFMIAMCNYQRVIRQVSDITLFIYIYIISFNDDAAKRCDLLFGVIFHIPKLNGSFGGTNIELAFGY